MKSTRALKVPFITPNEADLAEVADHFDHVARIKQDEAIAERKTWQKREPRETVKAYEARIREAVADRWRPTYSLTTRDGSIEDHVWEDLWLKASDDDVRVISMRAWNEETRLTLRLSLTGSGIYGSSLEIESEDLATFQRELGFFTELLRKKEDPERRRLSLQSWTGWLLWVLGPNVAINFALARWVFGPIPAGTSTWTVISAWAVLGVVVGLIIAAVVYTWVERITPRVLIRGRGPYQVIRQRTGTLVWLVIGALVAVVVSAFFGPGSPASVVPPVAPTTLPTVSPT